jgi:hypothetical protein
VLKRTVKESRRKRVEMEKTCHYEQIDRQRLAIRFETVKQKAREESVKSAAAREKDLEEALRKREAELDGLRKDIERVRSYQALAVEGGDPESLSKDLGAIRKFMEKAIGEQRE